MGTDASFTPPGSAPQDFFRAPAANGATPDGTNDVTEAAARTGVTGFGPAFATVAPVNQLDVGTQVRSGSHATTAPMYVTGAIPNVYACPPVAVPAGGAEFRHSNGTQGVGIGYNGIYGVGSAARVDLAVQPKGGGAFAFQWDQLYPAQPYNFLDQETAADLAVGQGFAERWYETGCGQRWEEFRIVDRDDGIPGPNMKLRHDGWLAGLGMTQADQLRPSYACDGTPSGFEWFIDADRAGAGGAGFVAGVGGLSGTLRNRKIVLFDGGSTEPDSFYGFGLNPSTLRYQVSSTSSFNRWYARTGACASQGIFSVSGVGVATVDPAGLNNGGNGAGLRFGAEASGSFISSKRTATGNQNGLDFGTASIIRMSMSNAGNIRVNHHGFTADGNDAPTGLSAFRFLIDDLGTPGNEQQPLLALGLENCGGGCSQNIPPSMVLFNRNATSGNQDNSAGAIEFWNNNLTAMVARLEGSQTGRISLRSTAAGGSVRLLADGSAVGNTVSFLTNSTTRLLIRNNGLVNLGTAAVQTFASDALAGTGGLVAGDIYKDATGILHVKL